MEDGQVTESREREATISAPHDVPIRDSAPLPSSRTLEGPTSSSYVTGPRQSPDVWRGAIERVQTQVSLNTGMLESNRRQVQDVDARLDAALHSLHQEMGNIVNALNEVQAELRARPSHAEQTRHDPADLEVLAAQVEAASIKAHEVDGLKMQMDLMKNRMKRWDEQGARPGTAASHPDASTHEIPPPPHHVHHPPHHPPHHPHLPPMRISPSEGRPIGYAGPLAHPLAPPVLESQGKSNFHPSSEPRSYSNESSTTMHPPSANSFRPSESLPPPSTLSGWRSADQMHHPAGLPPPPPQSSGWAAVNSNQTGKRPYEEARPSPYETPVTGSPKRPKLAPIMPRNHSDDASYVPTQSGAAESSYHSRSRATSDASQAQQMSTPLSASTSSYRFITSTTQADSQESWRPERERRAHPPPPHHHYHHERGRRGGRGGRGGRGRGGRGRGGGAHLRANSQELGPPDWEKPEWKKRDMSPNGYEHPLASRGGLAGFGPPPFAHAQWARVAGRFASGPSERDDELPSTPTQDDQDLSAEGAQQSTSGGKKTRTKPIRNAEGVLIRKDGRPDMRSVSSANNLRKVHAKKEAERHEMEGRTPTSARSLAPANSLSDNENGSNSETSDTPVDGPNGEGEAHVQDTQEQDDELGIDGDCRVTAKRFFPRQEKQGAPEAAMKTESESEERPDGETTTDARGGSQMTDAVMREMSDAQAEEHSHVHDRGEDTKMDTVEEEDEEEQASKNESEQETAEQPAS